MDFGTVISDFNNDCLVIETSFPKPFLHGEKLGRRQEEGRELAAATAK